MIDNTNEKYEKQNDIRKIISNANENGIDLECLIEEDNIIVLSVSGNLSGADYEILRKACFDLIDAGKINILFNLSKLNYPLSTGIGVFTQILKKVKENNSGRIILYSINSNLMEVFMLLGFIQYFEIASDENEAIRMVKNEKFR